MQRTVWQTWFIIVLLFLAAWAPRALALARFVTADERLWLTRSANFYYALAHGDLPATFQREHPGVTVMWAGMLGFLTTFPDYANRAPGYFSWDQEELESWLHTQTAHTPLALLVAGRSWLALAIAAAIALCYLPLRRLLGATVAAAATLFVAWDPFFVALSRQLHPDGLVAALTLLALVLFLTWLFEGRRHDAVTAGVVMGLAWLTKTPAFFLVSVGALLVLAALARWHFSPPGSEYPSEPTNVSSPPTPRALLSGFLLWGALAVVTFVALWPAMWVAPLHTLLRMATEMRSYVEGHVNPNFFWGETTADPGPWFYPVAYWFRTTPVTLLGLVTAGFGIYRQAAPFDRPTVRRTTAALFLFALLFTVGMTFGSKKFDRYLLPIFPALNIIAVLGWVAAIKWGMQNRTVNVGDISYSLVRIPYTPLLLVVVFLHGLLGWLSYPYYLTYFNPLAGGSRVAEQVLMVGWGEGLEQAADWLNQQPDASTMQVVAWYGDGPLSYFMRSREPVFSFWAPQYWLGADYAVVYISQWQRQIPAPEVIDFFRGRQPVHVVKAGNLELARIYDLRDQTPPDFTALYTESSGMIDCGLRLAGYTVGQRAFLAGDRFLLRLYLDPERQVATGDRGVVRLVAPAGHELWHSEQMLDPRLLANHMYVYDHEIVVPADTPAGTYTVTVAVQGCGEQLERERVVTAFEIEASKTVTLDADWGAVRLTEAGVQPAVAAGKNVVVTMNARGQVDGSLKISTRLVDAAGAVVAQADEFITKEIDVELPVPPETEPGAYKVVVVVYDPETLHPLPDAANEFATPLTGIEIFDEEE
ncbi:MAG: hypothetical protein DCC55_11185 [Chloroflexi bacterium]|nr:MAG: hypothetical protein DCC55_11185 [Chloroflexota bacterium]